MTSTRHRTLPRPRTGLAILGGATSLTLVLGMAGTAAATVDPAENGRAAVDPSWAKAGSIASIADVAERALPSVVNISTVKKLEDRRGRFGHPNGSPFFDPFFRRFFEGDPRRPPSDRQQQGLGSGVIVKAEGIVLTNNHVVEDAEEVRVTLHDGRELEAEIVGTDPPSDLAVLRLQKPPKDLRPLPLGDSEKVRLGEVVVAIGNPFGVGQTVTMGIVSAKGRGNVGIVDYEDFIQTDAAINPGNSGGALVDLHGAVIGINTAILSRSGGNQGIGFAIPSNMAKSILTSLLEEGRVIRGFLGVRIQDLTPSLASAMDVAAKEGVLVSDVVPDSPAEKGGLRVGDVITKVNDHEVPTSSKLRNRIAALGADREVKVRIIRGGVEKTVSVRLEELKSETPTRGLEDDRVREGLEVEPLTDARRRELGLATQVEGVVVIRVRPGTPAARGGLRPGDVIESVDRKPVRSPRELAAALEKAKDPVLVRVHRRGGSIFLVIQK